jgi:succinylglutamate desuccinylase
MADLYHRFEGYEDVKPLLVGSDEDALLALEGKPALIRIPGTDPSPRARLIATLLHGNEDSGFRAVLDLLRDGAHHPFDLWVFIGNVRAASTDGWFANRFLDDQEDFNRVWGLTELTTRMRRCAASVLDVLAREADLEAAIDVHNNTGDNPVYAILPRWSPEGLHLAAACCERMLLWNLRAYTLMEALADRCPSMALECGQAGLPENTRFARTAMDRFLRVDLAGEKALPSEVYEMRARVEVRPEVSFAFGGALTGELDLVLKPGLDGANYGMLLAGTELGWVDPGTGMPLLATDMHGADVTHRYVEVGDDGALVVAEDLTPVMMVTTVRQTRQDCLFYVARRRR